MIQAMYLGSNNALLSLNKINQVGSAIKLLKFSNFKYNFRKCRIPVSKHLWCNSKKCFVNQDEDDLLTA